MKMNKTEHITTYTGIDFTPLEPDISQIKIEDIAHALSFLCRANGHITRFYSIAQHSINCAKEAKARKYSIRVQLACLIHDASEAYISDITRPVKRYLNEYLKIEKVLQGAVYERFIGNLTEEENALVAQIDNEMLAYEMNALMCKKIFAQTPVMESVPLLETVDFIECENEFLRIFDGLFIENAN